MDHAQGLRQAYAWAREGVIWISLLLLIKGHTDLLESVASLNGRLNDWTRPVSSPLPSPSPSPLAVSNSVTWPGDGMGDLVVEGDLIVKGCVLWEMEPGLMQNSCTVFRNTNLGCVFGRWDPVNRECICDSHYTGPLCDQHTCYGRGVFELTSGQCQCLVAGYSSSSMCRDQNGPASGCQLDRNIPCQGQCIDRTCICTLPGQLGLACVQCAFPVIGEKYCPGRTHWGRDYIDIVNRFGVCGGGYSDLAADILVFRGLNCQQKDCSDFTAMRVRCCVLGLNSGLCPGWQEWVFNEVDFSVETGTTVFNSLYRQRWLGVINDHSSRNNCTEFDCVRRAHAILETSDWPQLELDQRPNRAYILWSEIAMASLGMGTAVWNGRLSEAVWSNQNTSVFLKGSGLYTGPLQRQFILTFGLDSTGSLVSYCLADENTADWSQLLLYGMVTELDVQMYWVNVMDQPGIALPMHDYCGTFVVEKKSPYNWQRSQGSAIYPGARAGKGMWFTVEQNVHCVAVGGEGGGGG